MKTASGYTTNGTYLKFKCGFTGKYKVETAHSIESFKTEKEADEYIGKLPKIGEIHCPKCKSPEQNFTRNGNHIWCRNCDYEFNV